MNGFDITFGSDFIQHGLDLWLHVGSCINIISLTRLVQITVV